MHPRLRSLTKAAVVISFVGGGSLLSIRWMIQEYIRKSVTYKEAMGYLRENKTALELLGEPIKDKRVDVGDKKFYGHKDNVMWVSVPLKGKKRNGYLYYWVTADDPTVNKLRLIKVEFEAKGSEGNRVTLKTEADLSAAA